MSTPTAPSPMAELVEQQRVLLDAMKATHSESDRRAYAMDLWLVAHPEACHTAADYPGWTPGCPTCPTADTTPEVTA